jgi:hypothetical protein
MANTTYFGWETPDDTDLVKDGAAAIRTLGQAIDTSMQDLEGGTTGQILSKNSNADMDFVWVTNDVGDITEVVAGAGLSGGGSSGSVTLTNTVATEFDAKGDLVVGTGADTFDKLSAGTNDHRLVAASGETTGLKYVADTQNTVIDAEGDLLVGDAADALQRLAIGSNGNVLTVDTAVDGKIKWAAPASSGALTKITSASFSAVSSVSFPNDTFTSTYKDYLVLLELTTSSVDLTVQGRMRASGSDNTNSSYFSLVHMWDTGAGTASSIANGNVNIMTLGYQLNAHDLFTAAFTFISPQAAVKTKIQGNGMSISSGFNLITSRSAGHLFNATTQFDSFSLIASTGNFTGRYAIYGLEA